VTLQAYPPRGTPSGVQLRTLRRTGAAQAVGGGWTKIQWDNTEYNIGGIIVNVTDIQVPVTGIWHVAMSAQLENSVANGGYYARFVNETKVVDLMQVHDNTPAAGQNPRLNPVYTGPLAAADIITAQIFASEARTTLAVGRSPWLSILLLAAL
jgi:hypothetical protein